RPRREHARGGPRSAARGERERPAGRPRLPPLHLPAPARDPRARVRRRALAGRPPPPRGAGAGSIAALSEHPRAAPPAGEAPPPGRAAALEGSMLSGLRRHPFAVEAVSAHSMVLTYAYPAALLEPLLPPGLTLDTHRGLGFVAVALVQTNGLRPAALPR